MLIHLNYQKRSHLVWRDEREWREGVRVYLLAGRLLFRAAGLIAGEEVRLQGGEVPRALDSVEQCHAT